VELEGKVPRTRVGLLTGPEGEGTTTHTRRGYLPHCIPRRSTSSRTTSASPNGPKASLSETGALTLAIIAPFSWFASEWDSYRYAKSNLRGAFPASPDRSAFDRCVRPHAALVEEVALHLARVV
jgi:hypothetical protein